MSDELKGRFERATRDVTPPRPDLERVRSGGQRRRRVQRFASAGVATIVVVAGVAGGTTLLGDEGITPAPAPAPSNTTVELPVITDFEVGPVHPDTKLPVSEESIEVGGGKAAIIAIERPQVPPDCLVAAQLRLYIEDASDNAADQLAVYPSHVFNADAKRDGDPYGYAGTSLDNRPRSMAEDLAQGWSHWDVTDIVRLWLAGKKFPSQGVRAPSEGPIVLALRDLEGAAPFGSATFTSSDAAEDRPHLVVTQSPDCPSPTPDERRLRDGDDLGILLEDTIEAQGGTIRLRVEPERSGKGNTKIVLSNDSEAPIGYGHEYVLERKTASGWEPVESPANCRFTQELITIAPGDEISHPIGPYNRACAVVPVEPGDYRVSKTVELESGERPELTVMFPVAPAACEGARPPSTSLQLGIPLEVVEKHGEEVVEVIFHDGSTAELLPDGLLNPALTMPFDQLRARPYPAGGPSGRISRPGIFYGGIPAEYRVSDVVGCVEGPSGEPVPVWDSYKGKAIVLRFDRWHLFIHGPLPSLEVWAEELVGAVRNGGWLVLRGGNSLKIGPENNPGDAPLMLDGSDRHSMRLIELWPRDCSDMPGPDEAKVTGTGDTFYTQFCLHDANIEIHVTSDVPEFTESVRNELRARNVELAHPLEAYTIQP